VAETLVDMSTVLGERGACAQLRFPRGSFQRRQRLQHIEAKPSLQATDAIVERDVEGAPSRQVRRHGTRQRAKESHASFRALSAEQRHELLDAVHETRFINRSVPYIYATLLDEGRYYGSISTFYRVLRTVGEVGDRRDQATRPAHVKPELCAIAPNEVYAWDITKLHGPRKWTYYYLYVVIDIYSRYIVGWMVADRESSALARVLLMQTIKQQQADPSKLTIHADRGSSMTSKPVAFLLADLGVTKSHSRPHVSNDNPHIESLFKTAKYQPEFPATFANIAEARLFCRAFADWYNNEHRHSGIALLTPADVHYGRAQERIAARQIILNAAYDAHPERFVRGRPKPLQLAPASYINRPAAVSEEPTIADEVKSPEVKAAA
jgi:putative transposase